MPLATGGGCHGYKPALSQPSKRLDVYSHSKKLPLPLTSADRLIYRMLCPCCGKTTEQAVADLIRNYYLPCSTPGCGHLIDLKTPNNRALIKKLAHQCTELDTFLAERDKLA